MHGTHRAVCPTAGLPQQLSSCPFITTSRCRLGRILSRDRPRVNQAWQAGPAGMNLGGVSASGGHRGRLAGIVRFRGPVRRRGAGFEPRMDDLSAFDQFVGGLAEIVVGLAELALRLDVFDALFCPCRRLLGGSRAGVRRYLCSTRRYSKGCGQPITQAEPLEAQLVEWLHDFQPDEQVRTHVLGVIRAEAKRLGGDDPARRRELHGQLDRLRDLYVLGDLTKNQYVMKRQAIEEELSRHAPPIDPALAEAEALLQDFAHFWDEEPSPLERRKLISTLLDRVWQDGGTIVAVRPRQPFVRYFRTMQRLNTPPKRRGVKGGSDGGQTLVRHPIEIRE